MGKSRKALNSTFEIAMNMEAPINDALGLTRAFTLIGYGLESIDDDAGKPTLVLADTLADKLTAIKTMWEAIIDCAKASK